MDCRTFALLLDVPETEWTQAQREEMEAHAASCAECARDWAIRREMRAMDAEEALPETFSASWRNAMYEEEKKSMSKSIKTFPWRRVLSAAAAFVVVAVGTTAVYLNDYAKGGKGNGSSSQTMNRTYESGYAYEESAAYDGVVYYGTSDTGNYTMAAGAAKLATSSTAEFDSSKIIRTVNITLRTQQFEQDYDALRALAAGFGGRVESLSLSGDGSAYNLRKASFTFRIPSAQLDGFISGARGVGSVSSYTESSEDVSENYYDIRTRLNTQVAKMERLAEMMERAENVEELIELENAISDTQYWIDYYTGQLNSYDSRVADSYVYVTLREISSAAAADDKELTLGERIVNAVEASIEAVGEVAQAFVIFVIAALPWLAILAVVVIIIRVAVRRRRKAKGTSD
ncbi:MAG: DUF4349 domain-containing protein [Clostridia bacterium]|nr:DUF4349 domain-containing protein [Clostridia bacterium]